MGTPTLVNLVEWLNFVCPYEDRADWEKEPRNSKKTIRPPEIHLPIWDVLIAMRDARDFIRWSWEYNACALTWRNLARVLGHDKATDVPLPGVELESLLSPPTLYELLRRCNL